ncbi:MAG TPA: glycosyl hydrolase [Tepidisphaeraceae bacterium]|jgi:autotransporter-associated beta strand protein
MRLAIAAATAVAGTFPALVHGDILSSKRGFADTGANYNNLQATGSGWYYTWGTGAANPGNFDAKFYPMFWNAPSQTTINNVKNTNPQYVLGFNEPERSDQANMTVAQAITSWTAISNSFTGTTTQLVSPSVADTGGATGGQQWLANFMSMANTNGLKVDAVSFHWYGVSTPDNPSGAASSFLSRVDSYHNSYGKPVFITEFAIHDWGGIYTDAQIIEANRQFLNIVIPGLESRSYVAGYAWYNWFSDSPLYSGSPMVPTPMGYSYIGAVGSGSTIDIGGKNLGEHVAYLTGGSLTMTGSAATFKYINALANTSNITGTLDWGLNSPGNWVRIQPGATLRKSGSNQVTFGAGSVADDGVLEVAGGVLRLGVGMSGIGSINISSTGDSTGSTARLELTGNINISNPITFAQRNDPGGSDGIRNVSGNNVLSGPMTIVVGGNQARIRSDAGQLTLGGAITTNATTARNLYLQGAGNGIVGGVISDNASSSGGKINLIKEGGGVWTLMAPNAYTGATTISGGVLRLGQLSASSVTSSAIANYSFDNVSGSTVVNEGTGGASMNGSLAHGATIVGGGRFGNAASLSGGASVDINSPITSLNPGASWTVSAWVKTSTAGGSFFEKGDGVNWSNGNTILYLGDGTGQGSGGVPSGVRWAGGFFQGSTSASVVNDNAWHQVTYVNGNGAYAIYVDGVAQTLSAYNASFGNNDIGSVVRLGISTNTVAADGTVNYNGLLDSVQVYNQALSPTQVAALYQGSSNGFLPAATDVTVASGATLDVNGTTQQIASLSGPAGSAVALGAGQLTVSSVNSSQFAGVISGVGGSLVKGGASVLTLTGANTYTGGTTVNAGALITGSNFSNGPLTINGGLAQVLGKPTPNSPGGTTVVPSLSIAPGGQLDLTNNSMVIQYAGGVGSLVNDTRTRLLSGLITSSAADATHRLGYGDNAILGKTSFGGVSVDSNAILIKYTYAGDADLDGDADGVDIGTWATNFTGELGGTGSMVWTQGDWDYDGDVDGVDAGLWAQAFTGELGGAGLGDLIVNDPNIAPGAAAILRGLGITVIPEPATAVVLVSGVVAALGCRRRSRDAVRVGVA